MKRTMTFPTRLYAVLLVGCAVLSTPASYAAMADGAAPRQVNVPIELTFTAAQSYQNIGKDVQLDVVFHGPDRAEWKVPAFWAGGTKFHVRFAAPRPGRYTWSSVSTNPKDAGLHGQTGELVVQPYLGQNPLFLHGALRVAADRRHFAYADGTPFFWLGDTWWMGLCQRLHWPDEFQQLAADRKAKGFNVIQIVAGLYPDMPAFDPRGASEAGFPWEKDYSRIRPEYFDRADRRLAYLVDQGFVPCIVGAWGYHLTWMGTERIKEHWRYLIARYAALPVVWCAAGEGTMPFYGSKHAAEDAALQKQGWTEVIRYIHATDPFRRLITIHPSRSARETVADASLLDFDMHQTGHGPESNIGQMAGQIRGAYEARPIMPVIAGESNYDGLDMREWGGPLLSSDAARQAFWACLMNNGAAGGTYGANGIWQLNRRHAPYGPSPHGRSWGSTPWDEAMRRPGSTQVSLAKQFFAQYPWQCLESKPDTATWADNQPAQDDIRPSALGIGTELRIVYVPRARPITVKQLSPQAAYAVCLFDPVTGAHSSLGKLKTDAEGTWHGTPPSHQHDWVVVLDRRGDAGENHR